MSWVPRSCTLPTVEQPVRLAEFDAVFATTLRPAERVGPAELRLHLPGGESTVRAVRDLIGRETRCCSFSFELRASATATELQVRVPVSQCAVLDAVLERAEAVRAGATA